MENLDFNKKSKSEFKIESDQETLEQREEVIELPFSKEDFHLLEATVKKYKDKVGEGGNEIMKKIWNFGTNLKEKYGNETREVALHHIITGSSGYGLDDPEIKKVDFEGEDSIAKFIDNL